LRSRLQQESAMFEAPELLKASRYRRTAATCGTLAASAVSPADRELLLRMQRSWLDRAHHEDWLDGLPPTPPARSNALALPRTP
jgi:hypothetical protein